MSIFDSIKRLLGLDKKPQTPPKKQYYGISGREYPSNNYLIEIRFINTKIQRQIKNLEDYLDKKFRVGKHHYVPHITLVGGFTTTDENRLINDFFSICSKSPIVKLSIKGFGSFDSNKYGTNTKVVYFDIKASEELKDLRYILAQNLEPYCQLNTFDFHPREQFVFHATLANNVPEKIFNAINNYLQKTPFNFDNYIVPRITLLKNSRILKEYDFFQKKLLTRDEARDPYYYRRTDGLVQQYLNDKYLRKKTQQPPIIPKQIQTKQTQIFFFSDSHFDHENIIRCCNRPFSSIKEMNRVLVDNWNSVVKNIDTVYFLGDLSYGKKSRPETYWWEKLNGQKIFIAGSHDNEHEIKTYSHMVLQYNNKLFYLVHDPLDAPQDWEDWVIHGHKHNNDLEKFPFINGKEKRINVSAELVNYRPLNIETLFKMNFESFYHLETLPSN
jgi:calcineurin-like phosphoesterase family protein/2'-5' RNA ligase